MEQECKMIKQRESGVRKWNEKVERGTGVRKWREKLSEKMGEN